MTNPKIPDVETINDLIKRAEQRKKLLNTLKLENQQFDNKAASLRKSLFSKAGDYVKSVTFRAPKLPIPVKPPVPKMTGFPRLPSLPMGFKIPSIPAPQLTSDGGKYMSDMAETTARAAATAIKQKANAIATKIAAAATFPPTGIPVAAVLTVAENLADQIIQKIISSIQLPQVDIDSALQNHMDLMSQLSSDIDNAVLAVDAAATAADAEVAIAAAAYTAQKTAMDSAIQTAQNTADAAQVTANQADATANSALSTAQSAMATAQAAAASAAQAAADAAAAAAAAANQPPPAPPTTVYITPTPGITNPIVTPTPTLVPVTSGPIIILPPVETPIMVTYPLTISVNPPIVIQTLQPTATVSGEGYYPADTAVTISISNILNGYQLEGWYVNGNLIGTSTSVAVVVPAGGLAVQARLIFVYTDTGGATPIPITGPVITPTPTPAGGGTGGGTGGDGTGRDDGTLLT